MTCHTRSSPCLGLCSFYESINPHVSSLPSKACGSASKWELEKQHSGCFTEKTKSKLLLTNIYKNDIQGTLFEFSFNLQSGGTRHLHCILTTLTQPLCTWVWNVLWHESELVLRIIMRNSPCCLVCLFQIYCPLYHVVYLLSITSSSPELSQTSRSTPPQDCPYFNNSHNWRDFQATFTSDQLATNSGVSTTHNSQDTGKHCV